MSLIDLIEIIKSFPKTVYINFKLLPIKQALRIPIIVSYRCNLRNLSGKVIISSNKVYFKMIRIGFGDVSLFDKYRSRSIINLIGTIIFEGKCDIGHGSKISIANNATLRLGGNFKITAETSIACNKEISFGEGCLVSWDNLFIDSDYHLITDNSGTVINKDKPIIIGKNVWFGCRNTILKGTVIDDNCIVAANSVLTKIYYGRNKIIGGNPAKIIKDNINWER